MNVAAIMTQDPLTVAGKARLDRAMDLMDEHDIRHLPVLDDAELVGVLSDRDVLDATGWLSPRQREIVEAPSRSVEEIMQKPVATVAPDEPLNAALGLLIQRRIGCVPVLSAGTVAGMVTEIDILRAYADACRKGDIGPDDDARIEEHMTREPATIDGEATGDEAAALMQEKHVRHLPVTTGDKVVGIVSDRDVRRMRGRGQLDLALVREIMSAVPETAAPEQRLSSAALILSAERISALPVLSSGKLVGITTTVDLMIPCALGLQRI